MSIVPQKLSSAGESPDEPGTKDRILRAGQEAFAARGYSDSAIRDIAGAAGVNHALILRHFGSKEALFEAALSVLFDPENMLSYPREEFADRLFDNLIGNSDSIQATRMLAQSIGNAKARAISAKLLEKHTLKPLGDWLGEPDGDARAREIISMTLGFVVLRLLSTDEEPDAAVHPRIDGWMRRAIKAIVYSEDAG